MELQRGMTLIEMLVALVILASVLSLSSETYRYYVTSQQHTSKVLDNALDTLRAEQLLARQIAGTMLYYVTARSGAKTALYNGAEQQLMFVSNNSVVTPGFAALSLFRRNDGALQYCEQPLTEHTLISAPASAEDICNNYQLNLFAADVIQFSYFGWLSAMSQFTAGGETVSELPHLADPGPVWQHHYLAESTNTLPIIISLKWIVQGQEYEWWFRAADIDPARLSYSGSMQNG